MRPPAEAASLLRLRMKLLTTRFAIRVGPPVGLKPIADVRMACLIHARIGPTEDSGPTKRTVAVLESVVGFFTAVDFNGYAADITRPRRVGRVF